MSKFVAYIPNSGTFEESATQTSAILEANSLLAEIPTAASDIFVIEVGSDDLVSASWRLVGMNELESSDEFVGDDVDMLP